MYITGCLAAAQEALVNAYTALLPQFVNAQPNLLIDYSTSALDLVPRAVGVEYQLQEEHWPFVLLEFNPTMTRVYGLNPHTYTTPEGSNIVQDTIILYFEGNWEFTVYSAVSEERDRVADGLYNIFLLNPASYASTAFYNTINNYDLVQVTLLPSTVEHVGTSVGAGAPWNEEQLVYERTLRVKGIGAATNPYSSNENTLQTIYLQGTDTYGDERDLTIT